MKELREEFAKSYEDMKIYRSNPEVYDQVSQSLKNAPEEIAKQKNAIIKYLSDNVEQLDSTLKSKYPEVYNDVLRKYEEEKKYRRKNGIGHPWGTEYRRRVAAMIGLKKTVNSMYELGLASLLNA